MTAMTDSRLEELRKVFGNPFGGGPIALAGRECVAELDRQRAEIERLTSFHTFEGLPTDDPHWVFDFLAAKLPIWAEMYTGGPDEARECLKALKGINDECFALAANQCHKGGSDDGGRHRCAYQDEIERLTAELAAERDTGKKLCDEHTSAMLEILRKSEARRDELASRQPLSADGLSAAIMALRCKYARPDMSYETGFRDALEAAAELVAEHAAELDALRKHHEADANLARILRETLDVTAERDQLRERVAALESELGKAGEPVAYLAANADGRCSLFPELPPEWCGCWRNMSNDGAAITVPFRAMKIPAGTCRAVYLGPAIQPEPPQPALPEACSPHGQIHDLRKRWGWCEPAGEGHWRES